MLIPVRCFTCNRVIGHLWNKYKDLVEKYSTNDVTNIDACGKALDELGLDSNKYCCRRMLLGHVDIIDTLLMFPNNPGEECHVVV